MADCAAVRASADIVKADAARRYVVVSAPGKRSKDDVKVTDLLLEGNVAAAAARFEGIAKELGVGFAFEELKQSGKDYLASRGEYFSAKIFAAYLGYKFIDAAEVIRFSEKSEFDAAATDKLLKDALKSCKYAVIPGFYGASKSGRVFTFSRGGSDVTGSLIAKAVSASLYENFTDVDGFLAADPRIVQNPRGIEKLSYKELRELAYMGANVLHPESIFPVRRAGIPINIKNTFNPAHPGTLIMPTEMLEGMPGRAVTGIAGKKNYTVVFVEKSMMNNELGFARKVLGVFEHFGVSFEHMPTGIDTLCVVAEDGAFGGKVHKVVEKIKKDCAPDYVDALSGLSLIATVGRGMSRRTGTAARLCGALAGYGINIKMIDQGSSEMNIIVGVATQDYEPAIKAIYNEFFS